VPAAFTTPSAQEFAEVVVTVTAPAEQVTPSTKSVKPAGQVFAPCASELEAVAMNKPESSIDSAARTKSAALVVEVFLVVSTETSFS
jgi:hypothetical protein